MCNYIILTFPLLLLQGCILPVAESIQQLMVHGKIGKTYWCGVLHWQLLGNLLASSNKRKADGNRLGFCSRKIVSCAKTIHFPMWSKIDDKKEGGDGVDLWQKVENFILKGELPNKKYISNIGPFGILSLDILYRNLQCRCYKSYNGTSLLFSLPFSTYLFLFDACLDPWLRYFVGSVSKS